MPTAKTLPSAPQASLDASALEPAPEPMCIDVRLPVVKRERISIAGWADIPRKLADALGPDLFASLVQGRDLEAFDIRPGDILLCTPHRSPQPGDLVAVNSQFFDGVCFRVYPDSGDVLLLPEGTTDPIALAVPPRPISDVRAVVATVCRPSQSFPPPPIRAMPALPTLPHRSLGTTLPNP